MENIQDKLIEGLKLGDRKAFNDVFTAYYSPLCRYCMRLVVDPDVAEEIVQDLFCKLWMKREKILIESSLKAYLFKATFNHAINYLNYQKTEERYRQYVGFRVDGSLNHPLENLEEVELKQILNQAIQKMPEKRRLIFEMSREQDMKYGEIAEKLNISVKTVEAHMSQALEFLRNVIFEKIGIFLPIILLSNEAADQIVRSVLLNAM